MTPGDVLAWVLLSVVGLAMIVSSLTLWLNGSYGDEPDEPNESDRPLDQFDR